MLICHKYKKVNAKVKIQPCFLFLRNCLLLMDPLFSSLKQFRYESQLQMVQVTGSLDNEYFYVDFREYEYDLKWEFPRENLEFGENRMVQMFPQRFRSVGKSLTCPHPPLSCREGPGIRCFWKSDECDSLRN